MLAHAISTVAFILVAAGITFQLATTIRFSARFARRRLRQRTARKGASAIPLTPTSVPSRNRHPHRDYRAALRSAGHDAARTTPESVA